MRQAKCNAKRNERPMDEFMITFAAFFLFAATCYAAPSPLLVVDNTDNKPLPKRFRIMNQNNIKMIGSGQFSKAQLIRIKKKINAPMIIIDLREESHGFVNELPISWYGSRNWDNKNKSVSLINTEQHNRLSSLNLQKTLVLDKILLKNSDGVIEKTKQIYLKLEKVYTEQQLAQALGLGYKRFYVTDHSPPGATEMKAFEQFVQSVPDNTWLYFHCRGGSGRTSTFMVLYDIIRNGTKESLHHKLQYQTQSGGKNLEMMPSKSSYKYPLAQQRLDVIRQFYNDKSA